MPISTGRKTRNSTTPTGMPAVEICADTQRDHGEEHERADLIVQRSHRDQGFGDRAVGVHFIDNGK